MIKTGETNGYFGIGDIDLGEGFTFFSPDVNPDGSWDGYFHLVEVLPSCDVDGKFIVFHSDRCIQEKDLPEIKKYIKETFGDNWQPDKFGYFIAAMEWAQNHLPIWSESETKVFYYPTYVQQWNDIDVEDYIYPDDIALHGNKILLNAVKEHFGEWMPKWEEVEAILKVLRVES